MGVGSMGLQFALLAKRRKVSFDTTLMLGRQNHFLDAWWTKSLFDRFGFPITEAAATEVVAEPYAEALFKRLGASSVDSMDASNYEGATVIHNLNEPIPASFVQKYSCVVDYGTLEHVFNFPVALKNATDMIKTGGHFLSIIPCNNMMGHGFYQFSPELYFNYLSHNGFDDLSIYMIPYRWMPYLFRVSDPRDVNTRVELVNNEPMQMGIMARKAKHIPEAVIPIQSDYFNHFWQGQDVDRHTTVPAADPAMASAVEDFRGRIAALSLWPESLSPRYVSGLENPRHYQIMDPARD